jgi:hypothetical protein
MSGHGGPVHIANSVGNPANVQIITNGDAVDAQNPFSVDGDRVYVKDIDLTTSTSNGFTGGTVEDLFNDLNTQLVNSTSDNPKTIIIKFNWAIAFVGIALGDPNGGTHSNIKIEGLRGGSTYTTLRDNSTSAIPFESRFYSISTVAGNDTISPVSVTGLRITFNTTNTISISHIAINKIRSVQSSIIGLKPDGVTTYIGATPNSNLKTSIEEFGDSGIVDAFGRLRISEPQTIFENKYLDGGGAKIWSEETNGTATSVLDSTNSCYNMSVSANNDFVIRQTLQRFIYQSGKSQLCFNTGILPSAENVSAIIGLAEGNLSSFASPYAVYNGIYFYTDDEVLGVCITKNGVDAKVTQANWNIDKLDGTGISGITIDPNKGNIYVIDYEWLGLGRVRFGVNIDGITYYCHYVYHANNVTNVYTKTPNLPVRYEIRSQGGSATMRQVCTSVSSEGGVESTGLVQIGTSEYLDIPTSGLFTDALTTHSIFAAVRHQSTKPYSFVELIKQSILTLGDNPLKWSISLVSGTTEISDNGVATALDDLTFTALPDSTLEFYSFDITQDTVLDSAIAAYIIEEDYIPSGTGVGAGQSGATNLGVVGNLKSIGQEIDGSRWCFLFSVQSYGDNDARSSLKFGERI